MPRRSVLLDTSFIVALENKDDPHHEGAKALDRELLKEDALLLLHWASCLRSRTASPASVAEPQDCNCLRNSKARKDTVFAPSRSPFFKKHCIFIAPVPTKIGASPTAFPLC